MKLFSKLFSYFSSLVLLGLIVAGVWFRQPIEDWYRLKDYTPAADISSIADRAMFSDLGRKLFYVNYPSLLDKETFNEKCTIHEDTIVLGCYVSDKSIYVYNVTDERLSGIKEVTAAHEMLHAAYDRLDEQEQDKVAEMTVKFYKSVRKDRPRLRSLIENYEPQGVEVVKNELHSILGTEVKDLPPELEAYYSQYFVDRREVVKLAESYEQVFVSQQEKIEGLKQSIDELSQSINDRRAGILADERDLNDEITKLNSLRASNDIESYNAAVPAYNRQVVAYQQAVASYNADIERLNELIRDYNQQAVEQRELYNAIDSRDETL